MLSSAWSIEAINHIESDLWFAQLQTADAVISMQWTDPNIPCNNLKLLQLPGAGLDGLDFRTIPAHTSVCNVFEHEIPIAEFVIAAILQWVTHINTLDRNMRKNNWSGSSLFGPTHEELCGKTIGIIGYGHIGREVAKRIKPFGVHVIGCGPRKPVSGEKPDTFYLIDHLDTVLGLCDFILISTPLTEETEGLISKSEFKKMKKTAVIINVARGSIINEGALYQACKEKQIGGAVIDTWYQYPDNISEQIPPSRFNFNELDNVIMSPHASAWTNSLIYRRTKFIAENLNRLARGEPLLNIVKHSDKIK
ncbi:MAG: 2-hydroxyacid dehydrogenase [Proteobacteria bacterium]|nr:2-hydroxyacid dehydrogenase [Pseudomonadota bacterium]